MVKSCGIHLDRHSVHLVALEGSPRKHRVVAELSEDFPPGSGGSSSAVDLLRRAAKENKLDCEEVGLVVDSGQAAFRTLTLPFDDRAKIEEVLKFELEGHLPHWNIDEVVADFLVTDSKPGVQSDLLVTAVPKARLAPLLEICEKAGLEASDAELDGTALFNAALDSGVLGEEAAHVLVHVGDASTTVVVADGGRLSSMRAIRAGARPQDARDHEGEEAAPGEPGAEEPAEEPTEDPELAQHRLAETARRIRREIARTVSGARLAHPLEAIHVCGQDLPGLVDTEILDVPVRPLLVVPSGTDSPLPGANVIAYGAALRELGGGVLRPHLRREELRYTGTFERLELPLAVFSLLLLFTLLVVYVVTDSRIEWRDTGPASDLRYWLSASNEYMLPNPETGYPGRLERPPEEVELYAMRAERGEIEDHTTYGQMIEVNRRLERQIDRLQRELGQVSEVVQPQSALLAASLVLDELNSLGDRVGRFALRHVEANYVSGRRDGSDYVVVKLDIDFRAEDDVTATRHYSNFVNAVQERNWCLELERKPTKVLDDGEGIYVDGITIEVDTSRALEEREA